MTLNSKKASLHVQSACNEASDNNNVDKIYIKDTSVNFELRIWIF